MSEPRICRWLGHLMTTYPTQVAPYKVAPPKQAELPWFASSTTTIPMVDTYLACARCGFQRADSPS